MKKIGILTFHDADNYGGVLQAYALQEIVKEFGNEVEIVNYQQPYIIKDYELFKITNSNIYIFTRSIIYNILSLQNQLSKKVKFRNFRKKYMNISKIIFTNSVNIIGYDTYIVGSDQVWNGTITNADETFFLKFCKAKENKIAYAASLGKDVLDEDEKTFIKNNINNIDYISVREDSALKILSALTDKNVEHVLDPTLVVSENAWKKILSNIKFKYKYILVYRLTTNEEVFKTAHEISKILNLKVLYITESLNKGKYGFEYIKGIGPEEFVTLFKNASFIVTDSFHGTTFSLIFNKNFVTIPHKTKGTRMISLLKLLKLDNRIITNHTEINETFKFEIDYKIATELLRKEKEKSINFLKKSIIKQ